MSTHTVRCEIDLDVLEPSRVALQVAVARRDGVKADELLTVRANGADLPAGNVQEILVDHGGVVHLIEAPVGPMSVLYEASVDAKAGDADGDATALTPAEALRYVLPSRYCPSDATVGFARTQFGAVVDEATAALAVTEWVHDRLGYVPGSTDGLDTAVDVLLSSQGVCRDFAHLVVSLCRGLGLPARLAAVYAPGLSPMDFHAVAEVAVDGRWRVFDATRLAPRATLLRIAAGRDAADTAFMTTMEGSVALSSCIVTAVSDGLLPRDDNNALVTMA